MAHEPVEALDISEVKPKRVRTRLEELCRDYREYSEQESQARTLKKMLMEEISKLAEKVGSDRIRGDEWLVSRVAGRGYLKKEKLLENGVSMDVIEKSTVKGSPYWQVRGS